ncbi:hypothetical protein M5K25_010364 [Dendrobium thyrsiflorum]|uniref:Uncharacterized protein n=1 Tax=Dendrobium thyrsiflorum TaxID=117978 RepID=A0ABD0V071_DENTH
MKTPLPPWMPLLSRQAPLLSAFSLPPPLRPRSNSPQPSQPPPSSLSPPLHYHSLNLNLLKCGHVAITTPVASASNVEFHPQCVTNPPTATCPNITACDAHPLIIIPLPSTLFSNSVIHSSAPGISALGTCLSTTSFTTQMNGRLDASSP